MRVWSVLTVLAGISAPVTAADPRPAPVPVTPVVRPALLPAPCVETIWVAPLPMPVGSHLPGMMPISQPTQEADYLLRRLTQLRGTLREEVELRLRVLERIESGLASQPGTGPMPVVPATTEAENRLREVSSRLTRMEERLEQVEKLLLIHDQQMRILSGNK